MESEMALQLSTLLASCEKRERILAERELVQTQRENEQNLREENLRERELTIRKESETLAEYRNVAGERKRNEDMLRRNEKEQQDLQAERARFNSESNKTRGEIHNELVDLGGFRDRLKKREDDLAKAEEALKQEKIKHRERVVKELAELDQKKKGII